MDSKVLITGGAGFLGRHTLKYVLEKYSETLFICVDKLSYASDVEEIKEWNFPNLELFPLDLSNDLDELQALFKKYQFDLVLNFAAESCVDKSFKTPLFFTMNNILSTQHLLECCRLSLTPIPILHISTDEVYGEQDTQVDENSSLNPTNPYAATKASVDLIIKSYIYSYNLPISIVRSNNIYGPGQYPEKIIPLTIETLHDRARGGDSKMPIHGDGHNRRTYLYVSDFVQAVDLIWNELRTGKYGEVYNVGAEGNGYEIDNISLVKLIGEIYNEMKNEDINDFYEFVKDRNYNDRRYVLNCEKIKALGWSPRVKLLEGIHETIRRS